MSDRNQRPLARSEDLLTQELDHELLVYERTTHEAHSLDRTAATLWRACDGRNTVDDLAKLVGVTRHDVLEALVALDERGLLATPVEVSDISRRTMLRRGLVAGGAMAIGAPVIRSVVVPAPAGALSPPPCGLPGDPCNSDGQCCSGVCFDYGGGGQCV